ncbi:MAG: hypothetical protein EBZ48_17160 [Proteobacteria bacterium]|nr:hypothetical protein [Pseudomonadota bacterium]
MFLLKVVHALTTAKIPYAVAGGYAVALHGAVRGTIDIDLVLTLTPTAFEKIEKALEGIGLRSKIPVIGKEIYQFREEYIKRRNLITWSFSNPSNPIELVDIIITHDLAAMGTVELFIQGATVKILDKKSLIRMKRESGRPQDLEDIKALEAIL